MYPGLTLLQSLKEQRSVAQQVLLTMADINIIPVEDEECDQVFMENPLASLLSYATPVHQCLLLECSPSLAFRLTSRLFDSPEPTSRVDESVVDTMAELVNMIGGNLKALLPPETSISVPVVMSASEVECLTLSARQLSKAWIHTTVGMLCLTVLATTPQGYDNTRQQGCLSCSTLT